MDKIKCSICGHFDDLSFDRQTVETMQARKMCFTCSFWEDYAANPHPARVICKGVHYIQQPSVPVNQSRFAGFGGAKWKITRLDGSETFCNNLWHQGEIPQAFRERLPDNCKEVKSVY